MIYVALLRGINVGGKNKIDMKQLRITFEKAGMKSVTTYINSGNIIFSDTTNTKDELEKLLEKIILENFDLEIKILLLTIDEFSVIIKKLPDNWKNDKDMKSDVLFLWKDINDPAILDEIKTKPEIDTTIYVPGAILWSVDKQYLTKSGLMKLPGTDLYKKMSIRNVNTVRKIFEIMKATKK